MTVYKLFSGIELIYHEFESNSYFHHISPVGNVMEINHCQEGRAECKMHG
jgi:hypothetical protein